MASKYGHAHIDTNLYNHICFSDMHPFYFVVGVNNHRSGTLCVKNGRLPGQGFLVDHITWVCAPPTILESGQLKVGI